MSQLLLTQLTPFFLLCEAAFAGGLMLVHIPFYVTDLLPTETCLFELLCLQPRAYPKECQSLTRPFDLTLHDICYEGREDIWIAVRAHTNILHAQARNHNPVGTVIVSNTHWNHHAMHMSSQMATWKKLPLRQSIMTKSKVLLNELIKVCFSFLLLTQNHDQMH